MRVSIRSVVCAMLIVLGASLARGQVEPRTTRTGTVDGVVTDTNFVSLAEATVSIMGSRISVVTGENGRFRMVQVPSGQYVVVVRRLGHAPVSAALQVSGTDTLHTFMSINVRPTPINGRASKPANVAMS